MLRVTSACAAPPALPGSAGCGAGFCRRSSNTSTTRGGVTPGTNWPDSCTPGRKPDRGLSGPPFCLETSLSFWSLVASSSSALSPVRLTRSCKRLRSRHSRTMACASPVQPFTAMMRSPALTTSSGPCSLFQSSMAPQRTALMYKVLPSAQSASTPSLFLAPAFPLMSDTVTMNSCSPFVRSRATLGALTAMEAPVAWGPSLGEPSSAQARIQGLAP
mmetsp:Transcript_16779/g.39336  ORF Transcript_16779/g.39336 Transcript_16779/m.39336 type:complete len:217 (+) Transcript_16779:3417-4067(+)